MAEVVWTDEAKLWLREIFEFIAEDRPDTATRVIDEILAKAESLGRFPEMGTRLEIEGHPGLRTIRLDPYRIVYRCKTLQRVEIIGVFHDALDLASVAPRGAPLVVISRAGPPAHAGGYTGEAAPRPLRCIRETRDLGPARGGFSILHSSFRLTTVRLKVEQNQLVAAFVEIFVFSDNRKCFCELKFLEKSHRQNL